MNVAIVLEDAPLATVREIEDRVAGLARNRGITCRVSAVQGRAALVHALRLADEDADAILLSTAAEPPASELPAVLHGLDAFTVEVRIRMSDADPAGADAELFGLGVEGYAMGLDLLWMRERDA